MRTTTMISLMVLALTVAFTTWAGEGATVGSKAPAFSLQDQDGKAVKLEDFKGKVVVLEWVNPDCPFVVRHAKAGTMRDLATRYADRGVVWLGVNSTHYMDAAGSAKFRTESSLPYPILVDASGDVGRAYGAKTTPHMYIVDREGAVVYAGGIDDDPRGDKGKGATNHVAAALDQLLAGKPVAVSSTTPYGCSVKYAK